MCEKTFKARILVGSSTVYHDIKKLGLFELGHILIGVLFYCNMTMHRLTLLLLAILLIATCSNL